MPELIQIERVTKVYQTGDLVVRALRGITLTIDKGEFVALMGPSGSGKSTFLNVVGCLDRPNSGRYLLDGLDVGGLSRNQLASLRNRKIGFVFQNFNLLPKTTAIDNVELPNPVSARQPAPDRRQLALAALKMVGLAEYAHHHPNQLSGGQQQRVAIARALVNSPEIILADEPTGALDSRTSIEIMAIFQRLNRESGITLMMVTHEPDIAAHASRIIRFRDGRVLDDRRISVPRGAAEELLEMPLVEDASDARGGRSFMTPLLPSAKIAYGALRTNKVRAGLTMLGVIIGVAAVIATIAVGAGATARIQQQIASLGSNLIIVIPGSITTSGIRLGSGIALSLTEEDARCDRRSMSRR